MNLLREKARATGAHRAMCSDAPDTSGMNAAAARNAEISKEALDWYKQVYEQGRPDREAAAVQAREQASLQNQLSRTSLEYARDEKQRFDTTFRPIEARIASEAMNYDSPERREAEARAASADAEQQISLQRGATGRELMRRGVMPGSGRDIALRGSMDLGAAKLRAGAANTARQRVETVGHARRMEAAGLGRGVITNQATQAQIGLTAGNSGVANANVPNTINTQAAGLMGQGFQTALQGSTSSGQMYGQISGIQSGVDAANGQTAAAGVGAAASIAIAI